MMAWSWRLANSTCSAGSSETSVCVAFVGVGAVFVTASFGLSLALGTFLAGLVISESEYGLQAVSDVRPFRDTFSGIFFISVGMLLDIGFVGSRPVLVLGAAVTILLLKIAMTTGAVLTLRRGFRTSLISGISLAQVGEFSFILASVAAPLDLFVDHHYQLFIASSVLTMMLTPFLVAGARPVTERLSRLLRIPRRLARTRARLAALRHPRRQRLIRRDLLRPA